MNIKLQKADLCDISNVFKLFCELVEKYENLDIKNYDAIKNWELLKLNKNIDKYNRIICDEEFVGYINVIESDNEVEIDDFYIFFNQRNKGIGSTVLQLIKCKYSKPIFLYVFIKNIDAIKFYNKAGFVYKMDVDDTRIVMEYLNK